MDRDVPLFKPILQVFHNPYIYQLIMTVWITVLSCRKEIGEVISTKYSLLGNDSQITHCSGQSFAEGFHRDRSRGLGGDLGGSFSVLVANLVLVLVDRHTRSLHMSPQGIECCVTTGRASWISFFYRRIPLSPPSAGCLTAPPILWAPWVDALVRSQQARHHRDRTHD